VLSKISDHFRPILKISDNQIMRNIIIVLLFFICSSAIVNAQPYNDPKGRISGKVIDAITKQPVDYATVSISKAGSTSPFDGVSTDPKGNFTLVNVHPGDYVISVDFMGYKKKTIDNLSINSATPNISLGTIALEPVQTQLKSVDIVAKAPVVQNKIDKMVFNVANDLTSQSGTASDVLQKVPQVTVDIDGNVQLQGNSNIRFLINGKPSSIFGASLADALQSIPATQIKAIEVITSPGAKYDANGTGGIINIVLKDSRVEGVNGNFNLSAGTRRENGNFNLNARKGNFGVNAFFGGGEQINSTTINTSDNKSYSGNTLTDLYQHGSSSFTRGGFHSGISFNWDITKKDALTASFGYNYFSNHGHGPTDQESRTFDVLADTLMSNIQTLRNSDSHFRGRYFDYSLDYKKTFDKEGQELDILFNSSYGNNRSNFLQQTDSLATGNSSGIRGNNPGKDHQTDISIDYTQPISKKFTIEAGTKLVFENINNTVATDTLNGASALTEGTWLPDANQTYGFSYDRKVYAGYLSATFSVFNDFINGKAGLRDEYTTTSANFPGAERIPSYNTLAPSIVLSHKIDETQSFKLSYSYRIERPDYGSLNPFYNISDPHNISTGNPNLKPEIGHNYEFGYSKSFAQGANIYMGAFYRYNSNDLQSYTTHYDSLTINGTTYNNVYLNQRYNIGTETTEGISLFGSLPVTKHFNLRTNMMFSNRITTNPGNPQVSGFMYRINLNASYDFGHDMIGEAFVNYNSSQRTIQGNRPVFAFYNLAVRKQFWNKKASIGLTTTDPFANYLAQKSTTSGTNFNQTNIREIPFRSFGIILSYRFGKMEFKKDKNKEDNNNNDMGNDNGGSK
jgi:ferric enterobactin receptor